METAFSHYKSMGNFLDTQGQPVVRSGPNFNLCEILRMSSLPASIKRIGSKTTEKRWRHHFPHYKSMGAFCCHGNHRLDPICPKTLCSLSSTQVMIHIKFDQFWPTGFRDIQVWKCGQRGQRTEDEPLVYYKLTLWAFGSAELKISAKLIIKWDFGRRPWYQPSTITSSQAQDPGPDNGVDITELNEKNNVIITNYLSLTAWLAGSHVNILSQLEGQLWWAVNKNRNG